MRRPAALTTLRTAQAQFHGAVAVGSTVHELSGFRVHIWPEPDVFYRNVAVPTDPTAAMPQNIRSMLQVFTASGREARLEFFEDLWPNLPARLDAAGFLVEMRAPVLALGRPPSSVRTSRARMLRAEDGHEVLQTYLQAAEAAFDVEGIATEGECRRLMQSLSDGRTMTAMVEDEGRPVAGAALAGVGDVAEVAGVWSAPAYRGRGLARIAAAHLAKAFFANGGKLLWLSAATEESLPLYRNLGFDPIGTQLNYHRPVGHGR
ncbi:MAG: GNAT family N-acetyltransferase [Geminicoccaceae bacterium]|nr:GNAT family N-acetyltransferase [Geminicoccaceae bacterium]